VEGHGRHAAPIQVKFTQGALRGQISPQCSIMTGPAGVQDCGHNRENADFYEYFLPMLATNEILTKRNGIQKLLTHSYRDDKV